MRKHQVIFLNPGTFVSESRTLTINNWDPAEAIELSKDIIERHGAKPYGFQFQTILTHPPIDDGEGGLLDIKSKVIKTSGIYFLGGNVEYFDDIVARNLEKESILRSNMEGNGYLLVCINTNSFRSVMPFNENDNIVDSHGKIIVAGNDPKFIEYRKIKSEQRKSNKGY